MNLRIVLVSPQGPINVGSVARVMANFDFHDLRIVTPRCDLTSPEIELFGKGGGQDVLKALTVHDQLKEAIEDCQWALALSRRDGQNYPPSLPWSDWQTGNWSKTLIGNGALVFGREDDCLSAEELSYCTHQLAIPTSPKMPTLNLSHAVALVIGTIFTQQWQNERPIQTDLAQLKSLETLLDQLKKISNELEISFQGKSDVLFHHIRRTLQKSQLSEAECKHLQSYIGRVQSKISNLN